LTKEQAAAKKEQEEQMRKAMEEGEPNVSLENVLVGKAVPGFADAVEMPTSASTARGFFYPHLFM